MSFYLTKKWRRKGKGKQNILTNLVKKQKPKREPRFETEPTRFFNDKVSTHKNSSFSGYWFPRYVVFPNPNLTFQKQKIANNKLVLKFDAYMSEKN